MTYSIFDIEADGLIETVTKIHCLCYYTDHNGTIEQGRITDYSLMKEYLNKIEIGIGHNIVRYDIPVLEKILGIKCMFKLIDTLALSWYLFPNRTTHGLGDWGADFGIPRSHQ